MRAKLSRVPVMFLKAANIYGSYPAIDAIDRYFRGRQSDYWAIFLVSRMNRSIIFHPVANPEYPKRTYGRCRMSIWYLCQR